MLASQAANATNYVPWGHNAAAVQLIRTAYPQTNPTTYPGHDPSEWAAVDYMLPHGGHTAADVTAGWRLAHYAQALAIQGGRNIHYIVYRQHIWNIQRAAEGWRPMADRGSWTQNHMDHVHVSFWN
jgi:hypothetical protein